MKKLLLTSVILSSLCIPAFAWSGPCADAQGCAVNNNTPTNNYSPNNRAINKNTFTPTNVNRPTTNVNVSNGYNGGNFPVAGAYAPTVMGGPCTGPGASVGGQFQLFGLSVGGNQMDWVCQFVKIGDYEAAKQFMCLRNNDVKEAFKRAGHPCDSDDAPVAPQAVAQQVILPVQTQKQTLVSYCKTHSNYPECHGVKTGG